MSDAPPDEVPTLSVFCPKCRTSKRLRLDEKWDHATCERVVLHRAHHVYDKRMGCERCGLSAGFGMYCPPGFWMTEFELKDWESRSDAERVDLERRLIAADKTSGGDRSPVNSAPAVGQKSRHR